MNRRSRVPSGARLAAEQAVIGWAIGLDDAEMAIQLTRVGLALEELLDDLGGFMQIGSHSAILIHEAAPAGGAAAMSQHYPNPWAVRHTTRRQEAVEAGRRNRKLQGSLTREGQIVPLLVYRIADAGDLGELFVVVHAYPQAERLGALQALDWPTILVETEWTRDDL